MIVDDLWCVVGSTNMDYRSFGWNDEVNLAVLDPALAASSTRILRKIWQTHIVKRCRNGRTDHWQSVPWNGSAGSLRANNNRRN